MPVGLPGAAQDTASGSNRSSRFRGDVEGLRAVAIGLVLLFHAGLPYVSGGFVGVDVFFVISGFLITTQLVSELNRTKTVSLARFYARRAKRLLPAVGVVLVSTTLLVGLVLPRTRWREIGGDIIGSAMYMVNWRLADRSVDYLAEGSLPSPVQHFWSLAVEEQYYLIWPLLILVAAFLAKMIRRRVTPVLWLGLAGVVIPSFAWSLAETERSPARAFFETPTRMWELGIGAAVALGAGTWTRLPKPLAVVTGWSGLAAIAASGLFVTTETPWPGRTAVLPTLGAAAVIAAGFAVTSGGPASLLGTRPFRWVGGLSYSLYLWHWPLLVVAVAYWGGLSPALRPVVVASSFVPAWLTFRFVENPVRYSTAVSRSPRLALSLGANFTLTGVVAGLALLLAVASPSATAGPAGHGSAPGAAALRLDPRDDPAGAPVDDVGWMTPTPVEATADIPAAHADGCQQVFDKAEVVTCDYGDPLAQITVAVVGDSKITQWMPALDLLADQNGWRLGTYLKSSCSFAFVMTEFDGKPFTACRDWTEAVAARLMANPPDFVITSQGMAMGRSDDGRQTVDAMVVGLRSIWSDLTGKGSKIVVIADNPSPGINMIDCVERNQKALSICSFSRDRYAGSAAPMQHRAVQGQEGVEIVDLFDAICPTERCAPVIGNVLVYRQGSHITATYIKTLAPRLAAALSTVGLPAA